MSEPGSAARPGRRRARTAVVAFAAVAVLVVAGELVGLRYLFEASRERTFGALRSTAAVTARQIEQWIAESRSEATFCAELLVELGAEESAGSPGLRRGFLDSLVERHGFLGAGLLDSKGDLVLAAGELGEPPGPIRNELLAAVKASAGATVSSFWPAEPGGETRIDVAAPLPAAPGEMGGSVRLHIDAGMVLGSILRSTPGLGESGEVLLVRRDGDDVLFLSSLRRSGAPPGSLRLPAADSDLPAAVASRGIKGTVEGFDYTETPVLAAFTPVPGTDWFVIAKQDRGEALRPARVLAGVTLGLGLLLILVALAGMAWLGAQGELGATRAELAAARRAEEATRSRDLAVRASGVGLWDWDLTTNEVYFSSEWKAQLGFADAELDDRFEAWEERLHPDDRERVNERLARYLEVPSGELEIEYRLRHRDGSWRWLLGRADLLRDAEGRPSRMLGCDFDITERKAREARLQLLSLAIEQSPSAVMITDPTGRIEYVNAQLTRHTGYELDEVRGRDPRFMQSAETPPGLYEELWRTISGGHTWSGELVTESKGGELVREETSIWPVFDDGGRITHFVSLAVDVTEREAVKEALEETHTRLRRSEKMESLGRLSGGVAHDFNNLLTVIGGHAELLASAVGEGKALESVEEIMKATGAAAELTHRLLLIGRRDEVEPRRVDLGDVVGRVRQMLLRVVPATHVLAYEPWGDVLPVVADPGQLEQVVMNLAVNARDAIAGEGTITLRTSRVSLAESCGDCLPPASPGDYACVVVSDTGEGIEPEVRKRLFEPFFTTKGAGEGTGLGLATVWGVVTRAGGHLRVTSEPGRGATFEARFPLAADAEEVAVPSRG